MSLNYSLVFDTEEHAKTVLKPFGFVIDSRYGEMWSMNVLGRHTLSKLNKNNQVYINITLASSLDGFEESIEDYRNDGVR